MIISTYEKVKKAYTTKDGIISDTWENIAEFLSDLHILSNKEDCQLFNLWELDPNGLLGRSAVYDHLGNRTDQYIYHPNTISRCKANALSCWGIILDYDGHSTISEVEAELDGLEYLLYTTFRHTPQLNKFRVVLPFKTGITRQQLDNKTEALMYIFPFVDGASFSVSQSFYYHSAPCADYAYTKWGKGNFIDISLFADNAVVEAPTSVKKEYDTDNFDQSYITKKTAESLLTCSGLHYNGLGTKHHVLTLVSICKGAKMSFQEYDSICLQIAAPDSSLQEANVRKGAWLSWPGDTATKETRNAFIEAHNGVSKFGSFVSKLEANVTRLKQRTSKLEQKLSEIRD